MRATPQGPSGPKGHSGPLQLCRPPGGKLKRGKGPDQNRTTICGGSPTPTTWPCIPPALWTLGVLGICTSNHLFPYALPWPPIRPTWAGRGFFMFSKTKKTHNESSNRSTAILPPSCTAVTFPIPNSKNAMRRRLIVCVGVCLFGSLVRPRLCLLLLAGISGHRSHCQNKDTRDHKYNEDNQRATSPVPYCCLIVLRVYDCVQSV